MEIEEAAPGSGDFDADAFYWAFQFHKPGDAEFEMYCAQLLALPPDQRDPFIFEFLLERDRLWFLAALLNHLLTYYREQLDPALLGVVEFSQQRLSEVSAHLAQPGALRLPDDLSAKVLNYLPHQDRASLSQANRQSRKTVADYEIGHLPSQLIRDSETLCASARQLEQLLREHSWDLGVIDDAGKARFGMADGKPSLDEHLRRATRGMLKLAVFLEGYIASSSPRAKDVSSQVRSAQKGLDEARRECRFPRPTRGPFLDSASWEKKRHYQQVYQSVQVPCDEFLDKLKSLLRDASRHVKAAKRD